MKFATIVDKAGKELVATVVDETIHTLADLGYDHPCMISLIKAYTPELGREILAKAAGNAGLRLADAALAPPIPRPPHDVICIGQNYLEHALESHRFKGTQYVKPEYPMYFGKRIGKPVGQDGVIPLHADATSKLDYEAELAVVIGKHCDHAAPDQVWDHIFGYTIINDVSGRDRQSAHGQFLYGKSLDGCGPMGPWIVTADEFAAPPHIDVKCYVNGELRQNSNTNEFIFDIPHLITELSLGMALEPGDIIATGTPSGVGLGFDPPRFLKSGDVIECEIEGIGRLRNTVK